VRKCSSPSNEFLMRSLAILLTTVLLVTGLSVPLRAQSGPKGSPCAEIRAACLRAGFVPNGARAGIGLVFDCVQPIMAGTPQPAAQPLPRINPKLVAACRESNPNFGLGPRAAFGPGPQPPYPGSMQGLPPSDGPPPRQAVQAPPADGSPQNDFQRQQEPPPEAPPPSQGSLGQAPPTGAQMPPNGEPCAQIRSACKQAGFVPDGAKFGNGILLHCIRPIMAGTPSPAGAARALPQIDPQVVTACRASNSTFGQGRAGTPNYVGPPPGASSNHGGLAPGDRPDYRGSSPPGGSPYDGPPPPEGSAKSGVAPPPQAPPQTSAPSTPGSSPESGPPP
jgi:hypothetical protein